MSNCVTCELVERRDHNESPLWDSIRRTPSWDIVHAFGTTIEGWLVLVVRRHITSVADMSDEEATTLGPLIREVSRCLQLVLDCRRPTWFSSLSIRTIHTSMSTSSLGLATYPLSIEALESSVGWAQRWARW